MVRFCLVRVLNFSLLVPNKYKQKAENKIKENRNFFLGGRAYRSQREGEKFFHPLGLGKEKFKKDNKMRLPQP